MFLDTFRISQLVTQLSYANAYEVWDRAGSIAREMAAIWPGLDLVEGVPVRQVLRSPGVQLETGLQTCVVTLSQVDSIDRATPQLQRTIELWIRELQLKDVKRVSTKARFVRDFTSIREANGFLISLGLVPWPQTKVFNQPEKSEKNTFDLLYRFEDPESFTTLRLASEEVVYEIRIDPAFEYDGETKKVKCRAIVEFDRGVLGKVSMSGFRVEEWFKGFQHVLRRDIDKILVVAK